MTNTGYIINPYVQQVFTSGPNSGSLVSSSYVYNFNPSSSFTSSIILGETFLYKEFTPQICPLPTESYCIFPTIISTQVNNCSSTTNIYDISYNINDIKTNIPITQIDYSLFPDFNIFDTTSSINLSDNINNFSLLLSGSSIPLNKQQTVYFRLKNLCSNSITSSFTNIESTECPQVTTITNKIYSSVDKCSSQRFTINGYAFNNVTLKFSNINPGKAGSDFYIRDTTTNNIMYSQSNIITIPNYEFILNSTGIKNLEIQLCAKFYAYNQSNLSMRVDVFDNNNKNIYNFNLFINT